MKHKNSTVNVELCYDPRWAFSGFDRTFQTVKFNHFLKVYRKQSVATIFSGFTKAYWPKSLVGIIAYFQGAATNMHSNLTFQLGVFSEMSPAYKLGRKAFKRASHCGWQAWWSGRSRLRKSVKIMKLCLLIGWKL